MQCQVPALVLYPLDTRILGMYKFLDIRVLIYTYLNYLASLGLSNQTSHGRIPCEPFLYQLKGLDPQISRKDLFIVVPTKIELDPKH